VLRVLNFPLDLITILEFLIFSAFGMVIGVGFAWMYFSSKLNRWIRERESEIRVDAKRKSHSTIIGQVTEQLIPFLPEFLSRYNPKDTRFLGSPIDLIVFDGLDEGNLRRVVFVEIKTGNSQLSDRERMVRDVVQSKLVDWEILGR
jgi:predicted Holliday junction resolvase-like endonuclease